MSIQSVPGRITQKCFKIWAGATPITLISIPLEYLIFHFPAEKIEHALSYLIRKGITGKNFIEWYFTTCKSSNLEMQRELLRCVERECEQRKLTAKDLRK